MSPCTFRSFTNPSGGNGGGDFESEEAGEKFKPLFRCDGSVSSNQQHLNGKELAEYLEEVQQRATERGQADGREEACRLAQASLLPHLRSVVNHLNEVVAQVKLAEDSTSDDSVALAMAVVEQVAGGPISNHALDDVKKELRRSVSDANRYRFLMNRDDLQYLQQMMKENRLSWPDHPSIEIKADSAMAKGHCELSRIGDDADAIEDRAAETLSVFLSKTASRTT